MIQTSPPTKRNFSGLVNQWVIYDKYMSYEHAKEQADENEAAKNDKPVMRKRISREEGVNSKEVMLGQMKRCARILERMVNQNNHIDIAEGDTSSHFPTYSVSNQIKLVKSPNW